MSAPIPAPIFDAATRDLMDEVLEKKRRSRARRILAIGGVLALPILVVSPLLGILSRQWPAASKLAVHGIDARYSIDSSNWMLGGQTALYLNGYRWNFSGSKHPPDLADIDALQRVTSLEVSGDLLPSLHDLPFLERLKDLRSITIDSVRPIYPGWPSPPPMTGEFLGRIPDIGKLQFLALPGNRITDADLAPLTKARSLEELDLSSTMVTDKGLLKIAGLPRLVRLQLSGSRVTPEGIAAAEKLNPALTIDYDPTTPKFHPE